MAGKNGNGADLNDDDDDDDLQELGGGGASAQELAEDAEARAAENDGEGETVEIIDDDDDKDERVGAGVEGERTNQRQQQAQPGRGRENETAEQRQERRRNERKAAKQRQIAARNRDKAELNFLRAELDRVNMRQNNLERGHLVTQAQSIENNISYLEQNIRKADEIIAQGVDGQNGEDVVKATRIRENLVKKRDQLIVARSRLQEAGRSNGEDRQPSRREPVQNQPNPLVVAEFQRFIQRNDWFDPQGKDQDSAIVLAIDNALTNEGEHDPSTPAYWKELERRVKKQLPHMFDGSNVDDEDDEDLDDPEPREQRRSAGNGQGSRRQAPQRRSGGPRMPSNAGGGGGAPKTFYISAERKQAMIEAGVWDDTKLRNRYIKQYQKWDAANASRDGRR